MVSISFSFRFYFSLRTLDITEKLRARSTTPNSATSRLSTPYLFQNGNAATPDVEGIKIYGSFKAMLISIIKGKFHAMLPIVSEVVENALANSDLLYSFDPKAELGVSFFDSMPRLPADVINAVFVELESQVCACIVRKIC